VGLFGSAKPDLHGVDKRSPLGRLLYHLALGRDGYTKDSDRWDITAALQRMNDQRAVPALIDMLKDKDPRTVQSAAIVLGSLKDARAVQPIREALEKWKGRKPPFAAEHLQGALRVLEPVEAKLRRAEKRAGRTDAEKLTELVSYERSVAEAFKRAFYPVYAASVEWTRAAHRESQEPVVRAKSYIDGLSSFCAAKGLDVQEVRELEPGVDEKIDDVLAYAGASVRSDQGYIDELWAQLPQDDSEYADRAGERLFKASLHSAGRTAARDSEAIASVARGLLARLRALGAAELAATDCQRAYELRVRPLLGSGRPPKNLRESMGRLADAAVALQEYWRAAFMPCCEAEGLSWIDVMAVYAPDQGSIDDRGEVDRDSLLVYLDPESDEQLIDLFLTRHNQGVTFKSESS
jgi:hypothetical protein